LAPLISGTSVWSQSSLENFEIVGKPWPKGIDFQPPVTELARDLQWLENCVFYIITVITLFVVGLLLYATFRFSAKRNPEPAFFTHNSPLEVAWNLIPVAILIFIGAFSVPVLIVTSKIIPGSRDVVSLPIDTKRIPNKHLLQYAITWFSLVLVWAAMTGYLVLGIKRQTTG
jgi:heme/copper-type cytochrome/quinol oxidase subunit 2